uniref:Ion_trans_N domain-containing protein n=1 Tax=Mesocestoides corti TaxID=53468 RepID=A0A5K3EQP6_MESCO
MRRLSEQLTEATLAAMQVADANFPGKALLDAPILVCPNCHKPDPFFPRDKLTETTKSANWHVDSQRYRRSQSVALSGLDSGCECCLALFYQNPLKDYVWSRPSANSCRNSYQNRVTGGTPRVMRSEDIPRPSWLYPDTKFSEQKILKLTKHLTGSFTGLPTMASQHTQTIFSSITTSNEVGDGTNKARHRQKSGSMYAKQSAGLRFQLPAALQKPRSFCKRGLNYGLRKTLSVTNAIVRIPIESAVPSSKKNTKIPSSETEKSSLIKNSKLSSSGQNLTQDHAFFQFDSWNRILRKKKFHASEPGSLHSLPAAELACSLCRSDEVVASDTSITKDKQRRSEEHINLNTSPSQQHEISKSVELQAKPIKVKKDVQLQTMEDFEHEIKSSFNIPRILNEEDQNKEPNEDLKGENWGCQDDSAKQRSKEYWKEQFLLFFQPSDNKLAKKLFGTKVALNRERSRQRKQGITGTC